VERFIKGDIVVVPFPFSDLSHSKRRPTLVVQHFNGEDLLLAQITSQNVRDEYGISLQDTDFKEGALKKPSNIRPNKLFTCSKKLILYRIGCLKPSKMREIIQSIKDLIER
jgi:mRNA interferase MazF